MGSPELDARGASIAVTCELSLVDHDTDWSGPTGHFNHESQTARNEFQPASAVAGIEHSGPDIVYVAQGAIETSSTCSSVNRRDALTPQASR